MLRRILLAGPFVLVVVFACAEGSDIGEGGGGNGEGGVLTGAGPSTVGSGPVTSGSPASTSANASTATSGSTSSATSTTGSSMMCDFTAPDTCPNAEILPAIAGDVDGPTVTRTGDSSKWYKVHIQEQDSNVFETDLSYRVTLTSPPGMNYDLRVYQGPQDGSPDCTVAPKNGAGTPETVTDSWDDDQGFGGEDDSVWLNIEVEYVSGSTCGPSSQWTLTVEGKI